MKHLCVINVIIESVYNENGTLVETTRSDMNERPTHGWKQILLLKRFWVEDDAFSLGNKFNSAL